MATGADNQLQPPVIDLHVHAPDFVPQPIRTLWHAVTPGRPRPQGFDALRSAAVDVVLATAVGDPVVTRWYRHCTASEAVERQLQGIERAAKEADPHLEVILGVEGGDFLADADDLDRWHERGVQAVVLVHLRDNQLGTTCMPWQRYVGPVPVRRHRGPGLTPMGARVVAGMNRLGMLVDLAHCDRATLLDAVSVTQAPVVSTHTGARALQDFPRFLADDEIRAIASTGGLVGLWPYRYHGRGAADLRDLVAHARHFADLVGAEHIAIGTDMNGVPGHTHGFGGAAALSALADALEQAGFGRDEISGIFGGNAQRVLQAVCLRQ